MNTWRRLTGSRRDAARGGSSSGATGRPGPAQADAEEEPEEEFDLVALQSTPDVFMTEDCDVMSFELNSLSARYTLAEIEEVKELRHRQLHVRAPAPPRYPFTSGGGTAAVMIMHRPIRIGCVHAGASAAARTPCKRQHGQSNRGHRHVSVHRQLAAHGEQEQRRSSHAARIRSPRC